MSERVNSDCFHSGLSHLGNKVQCCFYRAIPYLGNGSLLGIPLLQNQSWTTGRKCLYLLHVCMYPYASTAHKTTRSDWFIPLFWFLKWRKPILHFVFWILVKCYYENLAPFNFPLKKADSNVKKIESFRYTFPIYMTFFRIRLKKHSLIQGNKRRRFNPYIVTPSTGLNT
jgi:hypothetical protein